MNLLKKVNLEEFLILIFPIVLLLRSASLNIYLIILSFFLIYKIIKKKIKIESDIKKIALSFLMFYLYIITLAFYSDQNLSSLKSAFSQIRFFLFFLFIYYANIQEDFEQKWITFFSFILVLFSLDLFYQFYFGHNIFGIEADPINHPNRFSGFFGNELVAGTYLAYLSLPIVSSIICELNNKFLFRKKMGFAFCLVIFLAILISGDRMALIVFASSFFLIFFINTSLKKFLQLFVCSIILFFVIFKAVPQVESRYVNLFNEIKNYKNFGYIRLFSSSYNIWNENKIFGVGLKNYRHACDKNKFDSNTNQKSLCSTHPHNIFLELLAETGLIGSSLFLFFVLNVVQFVIFRLKEKKRLSSSIPKTIFGSMVILLLFLWPIRSSGSLFTTYYASYLWFSMGMLFLLLKSKNLNHG